MVYAVNEKVLASDINGFINTNVNSVNNIWSIGSGDSGYGQTALTGVTMGNKVFPSTWATLLNTITEIASHQDTVIAPIITPVAQSKIRYLTDLVNNITLINTNRLNAKLQGSTFATTVTNSASTWDEYLQFDFTITFANHNSARYFFNSGGQLGVSSSHPDTGNMNTVINRIAAAMGTIWLSSPTSGTAIMNGVTYNGVTKVGGGSPATTVINTNWGFYSWNNILTQVLEQKETSFPYETYETNTNATINVAYNGAGVITIRVVFDEVPNGAEVATGTSAIVTVRYPSTARLTDTWGVPTVIGTVTSA